MNEIFIGEKTDKIKNEIKKALQDIKGMNVLNPIVFKDYILCFKGLIFVEGDSVLFIKNIFKKLNECSCTKSNECFCLITEVVSKIENFDGEFCICILLGDNIFFGVDWLGRRSLGYTNEPFSISSNNFKDLCNPHYFYKYDLLTKIVSKTKRDINLNLQNIILFNSLEEALRHSIKTRLHNFKKVIFFSGGVDSLTIAIILHLELPITEEIYLINTSFKPNSWDRKKGKENHKNLSETFPNRKFILIDNLILEPINYETIRSIIKPKDTNMDINIATCLYYSAKKAKEISKIVYLGSGADELFGGYKLYKIDLNKAKENMKQDIFNLWDRNTQRDDKIFSYLNINPINPFLDRAVIKFAFNEPINNLISFEDKIPIRNLLRKYGFNDSASYVKKAMQFGSGLRDIEKKIFK